MTLPGSASYCSRISSTSHSLAPRSEDGATEGCRTDRWGTAARLASPLPVWHDDVECDRFVKASRTRAQMQGRGRGVWGKVSPTPHAPRAPHAPLETHAHCPPGPTPAGPCAGPPSAEPAPSLSTGCLRRQLRAPSRPPARPSAAASHVGATGPARRAAPRAAEVGTHRRHGCPAPAARPCARRSPRSSTAGGRRRTSRGRLPPRRLPAAFPGFTAGRPQARDVDRDLMTNADIGERVVRSPR